MRLEYLEDWPGCMVPGCTLKACLILDSARCFHHTEGSAEEKHHRIDAARAELGYDAGKD